MDTKAFRVISVCLLFCHGIRITLSQTQTLQGVTQWVGGHAVFDCSSQAAGAGNPPPDWVVLKSGGGRQAIVRNGASIPPGKYSVVNGSATLTVMNVELSDGLTYCCAVTRIDDYCGNLLVLDPDSFEALVQPSSGVSVGSSVTLNCSITYMAAPSDAVYPLTKDQQPHLSMFIGDTDITNDISEGEHTVGTGSNPHSLSLSVNRTIVESDIGKSLVCQVRSTNPTIPDVDSVESPLNVNAPAKVNVTYPNGSRSKDDKYQLGDIFICYNLGFPHGSVFWTNLSNPSKSLNRTEGVGNAVFTISEKGISWLNCSASNLLSNGTQNITVKVDAMGNNSVNVTPMKSTTDKVGLGVGLGIGLGVPVLIGVIVLIVLLSRRKKRQQPYEVKNPDTKTKTQTTGKSPTKNGKNPDPGPRNNVNPNPNPTYTTPVMPEQTGSGAPKNVRDSPGYGDLGVRHIGGSGSNPHLNQSFDSNADKSFDSASNRQNGGNLQFTAGRSNHSPSAPQSSV